MSVDIATAMQLAATMTLVIGAGLAFAATGYPPDVQRAINLWVRGLLLQTPAYYLFALRDRVPDLFSIVCANVLLMSALALQMHALREFNRRPSRIRVLAVLVALTFAGTALLTWTWPSFTARVVLVSSIVIAMTSLGIAAIRGARSTHSRAEHLLVLFLGIGIVIMAARIVMQPISGATSLVSYSPLQGIVLTYASLLPVITTVAFMLMCGERINRDIARLATLDPLTGVYNRRTMNDLAARAVADARRHGRPLALLALDVDHFKRINDEFGHDAGDRALCALVALLRRELRAADVIARIGGEEFVVILPDTGEADAGVLAERVRARISDSGFTVDGWPAPLQVSIGVGALDAGDFDGLRRATDRALYAAKRAGRNRVVTVSQVDTDEVAEA